MANSVTLTEPSLSSEDLFVETTVASWDRRSHNLSQKHREPCLQAVRNIAHQIFQNLDTLKKQGASRKDLQQSAQNWGIRLNQSLHLSSKADIEREMTDLDRDLAGLSVPRTHHQECKDTSFATLLAGPVAGGALGFAASGVMGLNERAAAMQARDAAFGVAQDARMAVWEAKWNQIQLEEMFTGIETLAERHPNAFNNLFGELERSRLGVRIAEQAVPHAEEAARIAATRVATTEIFPLARTSLFTSLGVALGTIVDGALLFLASDDAE